MFTLKYEPFGDFGHIYIDGCWYATMCPGRDWESWYAIYSDPALLTRWHGGTPAQLAAAVEMILAGKESAVPVLAQGTRADLRAGRAKIQGLKVGPNLRTYDAKRDQATGVLDKGMVPSLVRSLQDPDRAARAKAILQLGLIGAPGDGAVEALLPMLRDKDVELRLAAFCALAQIGWDAKGVPALAEALKDADPILRRAAVRELGKLGPPAKAALSDLAGRLAKVEGADRVEVAEALLRIDPADQAGGAFLGGLLEDPKATKDTRLRAADSLELCGATAVPLLIRVMKDADRDLRINLAQRLGRMGPVAKAAIPVLTQIVADDASGTVRMRAAEALPKLGPEAKSALPALKAALADPRLAGRKEVLAALAEACKKLQ
jgi:HEAT repeat protein